VNEARIKRVANKIAAEENDDAMANVDQAIDTMIGAFQTIQENLPHAKTENVPQRAALDEVQELMDEAIGPYLLDIAKAMKIFGE